MQELIRRASEARRHAYAPYSGYTVGVAIEDCDGAIWTGVNVENISYGATICGERTAVVKMVSAGAREIVRMALVTRDGSPPCGICLQVLAEFAPDPRRVEVALVSETGACVTRPLSEFLPFGFKSDAVPRT